MVRYSIPWPLQIMTILSELIYSPVWPQEFTWLIVSWPSDSLYYTCTLAGHTERESVWNWETSSIVDMIPFSGWHSSSPSPSPMAWVQTTLAMTGEHPSEPELWSCGRYGAWITVVMLPRVIDEKRYSSNATNTGYLGFIYQKQRNSVITSLSDETLFLISRRTFSALSSTRWAPFYSATRWVVSTIYRSL